MVMLMINVEVIIVTVIMLMVIMTRLTSHSGQLILSSKCFTMQLWRCGCKSASRASGDRCLQSIRCQVHPRCQVVGARCQVLTLQKVWRHSVTVVASTR